MDIGIHNICIIPESRFRESSLRAERSNLAFENQIATNPSGSRNDRQINAVQRLYQDLGHSSAVFGFM